MLSRMVTFPGTCSPKGLSSSSKPPSIPFPLIRASVSASASTATCGTNARCISVRYSSETPGGRLVGVRVPLERDPGEKTEPGTVVAVGVAVPELGRELEVEMLVVDSNSLERLGLERR